MKTASLVNWTAASAIAVFLVAGCTHHDDVNTPVKDEKSMTQQPVPKPSEDYDPSVEEPTIEDGTPQNPEDFRHDSQSGIVPEFGPMPGSGPVTHGGIEPSPNSGSQNPPR
ncbi:hypothetical protein FOS14_11240 [Skermania sp. ID1734]|uniref:hypothetical protein n=1 Tax=Skermania sp. ID1734 TaxID=2597516 RepID=UPI00117D3AED|nr:hypothetical protein [Skermania sp. ID1734]TSD99811.1 hypothetical protein FOS14_11240 [Skermania sp. ID1734]